MASPHGTSQPTDQERPTDQEGRAVPTIGIVGGHGGIGSLFTRLFASLGLVVLVSDRDTPLSNVALATRCDLALVAVPLRVTPAVLAEMASHIRPGAALVSLGSLMEPAVPALAACAGETFLLHPLFGPGRAALRGATLALAPGVPGVPGVPVPHGAPGAPWQDWVRRLLHEQGATVVTTTPDEHDRAMAVVQALLHGTYAALAPELAAALTGEEPLAWATPTLRLQLALMSRILHQDPHLYGDLLALNRHTPTALERLIRRLEGLGAAAQEGPDAVAALFSDARAALGPLGPSLAAEGDRALGEG